MKVSALEAACRLTLQNVSQEDLTAFTGMVDAPARIALNVRSCCMKEGWQRSVIVARVIRFTSDCQSGESMANHLALKVSPQTCS